MTRNVTFKGTGNVGIGTTSPPFKLTVDNAGSSGIVAGFENSSGECTSNPTGSSVNCSSDITLKKNITSISTSTALANILALDPVFFNWKTEADGTAQHSGFIAQSVQPVFTDLVSTGSNGKLLLNYAGFTPYLTAAIKETASISGTFRDHNLVAWLADASNGIDKIFAHEIITTNGSFTSIATVSLTASSSVADTLTANQKFCLGARCMTAEQFNHILDMEAAAGAATVVGGTAGAQAALPTWGDAGGATSSTPANDNQAPVIDINGNNPATVSVGETYADLGAVITSPQVDQNLGIHTFVDGIATDPVVIDTSVPGTHSIGYVVAGAAGLTSTSTRTVIVSAPANDNAPPEQASSSPPAANDNPPPLQATGTDATSSIQ